MIHLSATSCPWFVGTLVLSAFLLLRAAPAQTPTDPELQRLVDRIATARGDGPPASVVVEGNYTVHFDGNESTEPVAKGPFTELYRGTELARQKNQMGQFGAMERGCTADMAWDLDPMLGARVYAGPQAAASRRYFAVLRGERPQALYTRFERLADQKIADTDCAVVKMTTAQGVADTWYVEAATGRTRRIDIALPVPESADVTFGISDFQDSQLTFDDWRAVGNRTWPHRRTLRMGPATVTLVTDRLDFATAPEDKSFEPPKAVIERSKKTPPKKVDADGKPTYEIVDREAQTVLTIRTRCKPNEISKTLAKLLPEVGAHLTAAGGKVAGPPFTIYHEVSATEIDLEAGSPISKAIEGKGRVVCRELPAGRVMTTWHIGPYEKLMGAHEALAAQVVAQKLKPHDGVLEIYWTDPGMVADPAKWRTQLLQPVE